MIIRVIFSLARSWQTQVRLYFNAQSFGKTNVSDHVNCVSSSCEAAEHRGDLWVQLLVFRQQLQETQTAQELNTRLLAANNSTD